MTDAAIALAQTISAHPILTGLAAGYLAVASLAFAHLIRPNR